jgi:hypothetical protein
MTPSAEIAAFERLKKSGYGASQLVDARLTPEQARDAIFFATGVRIPAGLIEAEMRRARAERPRTESAEDAASDFTRDSLGTYHARMTGKQASSTTDLYKLIAQKV